MDNNQVFKLVGFFTPKSILQVEKFPFEVSQNIEIKANLANNFRKHGNDNLYVVSAHLNLDILSEGLSVGKGEFVVELVAELTGFNDGALQNILTVFLPNQLLPHLREVAASATTRTGFPQFLLPPLVVQPAQGAQPGDTVLGHSSPRLLQ
jgi:preprotein translocase subunit SecB